MQETWLGQKGSREKQGKDGRRIGGRFAFWMLVFAVVANLVKARLDGSR